MDSYIDLLSGGIDGATWDDSQNCNPIGEQPSPIAQATPSVRPNNKRTKNFTENENNVLVLGWLNISMDASTKNEQNRSTYWTTIHEYFHENKFFLSDRTSNSLMHRWSTIQEQVNRFCGCYDRIQNRRQSGITEQDKIIQACALYKAEEKGGKAFGLLHCWNTLHLHPKWTDRLSQKRQKTTSIASTGSSTPGTNSSRYCDEAEAPTPEGDPMSRPIGKKAEKERLRRGKSSISSNDSTVMEALDNVWSKKRDAEAVKEAKKAERYERAFKLEEQRIAVKEK